jgi:AcrR family transcriptional regulator
MYNSIDRSYKYAHRETAPMKTLAPTRPTARVPERRMPPARQAQREQPDRRLAILLAAEKLFALHGYHAVSIRDIAAEAGVPLALVGYHFGAKQALYRAIFESWQDTIDRRLAALRNVAAQPLVGDALEHIVDALVSPVLAMHRSPEGRYFALLAARDLAAPSPEAHALEREFFDPMAHAFIDALLAACAGSTRAQAAWCYQFAIGAMLNRLLTGERAQRLAAGASADDDRSKDLLLRFIAAGFRGALRSRRQP